MTFEVMRIFVPATLAFLIGIVITPFLTHYLYKYKMWKQKAGKTALDGTPATLRNELHAHKDIGTPLFGGVVVWASVLLTADLLSLLARVFPDSVGALAFISRSQTWVPMAALALGALVGFADDLYVISGKEGIRLRMRLLFVGTLALACAWWFYDKLDVSSVTVLFLAMPLELGWLFIPFFVLVALFIYAGGVIDGLDGLSGGVFAAIFSAYAGVAFFGGQYDVAALCAALAGGLLAFLWFNIPPARFYLSETGSMALTIVLVVIAFLTDVKGGGRGVSVLPIIALPLVATVASNIIQMFGKKVLGRKIFRIAPLHHHFEAIGWPAYKVTMRYWVVAVVAAVVGMALALI